MSGHHNKILNFSHSPYKNISLLNDTDLETKLGEHRNVQLMRDIHTSLSDDATDLI